MFIREYKTYNKKTSEQYINHKLVESVRTEKGPRQRVIMSLGRLDLPRSEWKKLAHALECQLSGQATLLDGNDNEVERIARSIVSNKKLSERLAAQKGAPAQEPQNIATVDLDSIATINTRSLGPELVCQSIWEMLGFGQILKKCGFSRQEVSLARAVIFGRLVTPGSELHTFNWLKKRTALAEMPGADISGLGKNLFYGIGDLLYGSKDWIEELLYNKEREYFPHSTDTIFLYDITNTYMEGSSLGNSTAAYGHCKSKRFDCPLIALSLVVRNDGMPVCSHIYKGSQSEPATMRDMVERLETQLWGSQEPLTKPTVAMDRGIATEDNIKYLRERGYPYVVISREDSRDDYKHLFQSGRETFTPVREEGKKSVYGDENCVYVKKIAHEDSGDLCKVLCISEGKARKEEAIASARDRKRDKLFVDAIAKLDRSIKKGAIKKVDKIEAKLARICARHRLASSHYEPGLQRNGDGSIGGVALAAKEKPEPEGKLYGCYVMETTHTELEGAAIWSLYMTLSSVESAFRSMKEELGMRPVFHQTGPRSEAHLFISVLAYHILATIKNLLRQQGDHRQWETIREDLSTHTRSTVIIKDIDGNIYHTRVSGTPEDIHEEIYKKLGVSDPLRTTVSLVKSARDTL